MARRLAQNEAHLVRCSAGCGTHVWLAGALPVAADAEYVCPSCRATWRCQAGHEWTGDRAGAAAHEAAHHEGAAVCWPIDEEVEAYRRSRFARAAAAPPSVVGPPSAAGGGTGASREPLLSGKSAATPGRSTSEYDQLRVLDLLRRRDGMSDVALDGLPMTGVDRVEDELADAATPATRLVQVDMTKTMLVRLPADEAEAVLAKDACSTDLAERMARWQRIAHHSPHHLDGYLTVSDAADVRLEDWGWPEPVDAVDGNPSYLWSAFHFVGRARNELSCGRYHEGHCPDLDEVNKLLGRLEEELRLMALAADPKTAALAEQERARQKVGR